MSFPFHFPFELLLAVWATSMVGLIWWSSTDAASLPEAATRGELYASRFNGVDFWTHVTENDLARAAARAEGHPVTPEDAAQRVLAAAPSTTGTPRLRVSEAKRCHLSGYGYILVTCVPEDNSTAIRGDILRFVVYASGEIGTMIPQQQQHQSETETAPAHPAMAYAQPK